MFFSKCHLIVIVLYMRLSSGFCIAQAQGFTESFDGTGEFTTTDGSVTGFDNPGWILSGSGGFSHGGFSVDLQSRPGEGSVTALARYGVGFGDFQEQVIIKDLELGDVTLFSSPDSVSEITFWAYLGNEPIVCSIGKTPGKAPFTSKVSAYCSAGFDPSERIEVPEGANISLGLDVNVQDGSYVFMYDPNVDDEVPAVEIGPILREFPEASTYYTLVRFGAGGQGTVQGRIDNWSLIPYSQVTGDFTGDGQLNVADVNLLTEAIRVSSGEERFDLNVDRMVDLLDLTHWVHDLKKTYFGDADLNGEFDSQDLTLVFQAGQYEDAHEANSSWATGDWNADAEFSSSDLIVAFQDGGYEKGPRAAEGVPEPTGHVLHLVGLCGLLRLRAAR